MRAMYEGAKRPLAAHIVRAARTWHYLRLSTSAGADMRTLMAFI